MGMIDYLSTPGIFLYLSGQLLLSVFLELCLRFIEYLKNYTKKNDFTKSESINKKIENKEKEQRNLDTQGISQDKIKTLSADQAENSIKINSPIKEVKVHSLNNKIRNSDKRLAYYLTDLAKKEKRDTLSKKEEKQSKSTEEEKEFTLAKENELKSKEEEKLENTSNFKTEDKKTGFDPFKSYNEEIMNTNINNKTTNVSSTNWNISQIYINLLDQIEKAFSSFSFKEKETYKNLSEQSQQLKNSYITPLDMIELDDHDFQTSKITQLINLSELKWRIKKFLPKKINQQANKQEDNIFFPQQKMRSFKNEKTNQELSKLIYSLNNSEEQLFENPLKLSQNPKFSHFLSKINKFDEHLKINPEVIRKIDINKYLDSKIYEQFGNPKMLKKIFFDLDKDKMERLFFDIIL